MKVKHMFHIPNQRLNFAQNVLASEKQIIQSQKQKKTKPSPEKTLFRAIQQVSRHAIQQQ